MGKLKLYLITVLLMYTVFSSASARDQGYKCTIRNVYFLAESGFLLTDKGEVASSKIDQEFYLDRGTGRAIGALTNFEDDGARFQPEIFSKGEDGNSFIVLTKYGPNPVLTSITVASALRGDGKRFVAQERITTYSGVCENI